MANGFFNEGVRILENIGVADVILPFFLVFVIVFAVLQKAKVFGEKAKKFNIMVALIMGFAVIFPHVINPYGPYDVVPIISQALPHIAIVVIAVVMLAIILGLFGKTTLLGDSNLSGWVMIVAILIVLYIFGAAADWWYGLPRWLDDPQTIAAIVTILVFAIVIGFITKDEDDQGPGMGESLKKLFKDQ